MTTLMTYVEPIDVHAPVTRVGGVPLVPAGFSWPDCAECDGPMQFLAQLFLDDLAPKAAAAGGAVLSIFMCQNDPGLCGEWDPQSGGNRALLFSRDGLTAALVPAEGKTLFPESWKIGYVTVNEPADLAVLGGDPVLGQLGGNPVWLQDDETPTCPSCAAPMGFVAQLEEGHGGNESMNFGGGGIGYAFACEPCAQGLFLFQC
ncbi:MAG: hypothetical protein JWL97_4131 [Gemmatimonadales bacterium]|jgi:hypothetical protein|nr:hypothetical protein [Gemmatimonadales bacterium]